MAPGGNKVALPVGWGKTLLKKNRSRVSSRWPPCAVSIPGVSVAGGSGNHRGSRCYLTAVLCRAAFIILYFLIPAGLGFFDLTLFHCGILDYFVFIPSQQAPVSGLAPQSGSHLLHSLPLPRLFFRLFPALMIKLLRISGST